MLNLEAIEARIDDLLIREGEIEDEKERLCEGCPAIYLTYEVEEYWGGMCRRAEEACPVGFEPGASGCDRGDEYEALESELESILREVGELQSLDVAVFAEEVA